jgi:hypothetical protein
VLGESGVHAVAAVRTVQSSAAAGPEGVQLQRPDEVVTAELVAGLEDSGLSTTSWDSLAIEVIWRLSPLAKVIVESGAMWVVDPTLIVVPAADWKLEISCVTGATWIS